MTWFDKAFLTLCAFIAASAVLEDAGNTALEVVPVWLDIVFAVCFVISCGFTLYALWRKT